METDLPLELLHKLVTEMKSDAKDKNFNYKLFGESELENMRKYRRDDYPEPPIEVQMREMLTEVQMGEMLTDGMEEIMVEEPTNEEISVRTGLRIDMLEEMRERVRRLRPRNPIEIGDDLP
jgi:hypothetical protein